MERRAAKEHLLIQGWLDRVDEMVERGKDAYLSGALTSSSPTVVLLCALGPWTAELEHRQISGVKQAALRRWPSACLANSLAAVVCTLRPGGGG